MSDEVELSMSIPLDEDGFLRRECPTCEREFKLFVPDDDELEEELEGEFEDEFERESASADAYFCPYCGVQAPTNAWWTKEQLQFAANKVEREVVGPELDKYLRGLKDIERSSGGLIEVTPGPVEVPEEAEPLIETADDMRRIDFKCHPDEPVKVVPEWLRDVYCLICGTPTRIET